MSDNVPVNITCPGVMRKDRNPFFAVALQRLGSDSRAADLLGRSKQAAYFWSRCPQPLVLELEKLSGVPRWQLRPDNYPPKNYRRPLADLRKELERPNLRPVTRAELARAAVKARGRRTEVPVPPPSPSAGMNLVQRAVALR